MFDVFSVIRSKSEVKFLTGRFLEALYFSNIFAVKTENLEEGFLRRFFFNFVLPVMGIKSIIHIDSLRLGLMWVRPSFAPNLI